MLVTPQAAQLGIYLLLEKQKCCTSLRDQFNGTLLRIDDKKAQNLAGIEPTTALFRGMHFTAVLHPVPFS